MTHCDKCGADLPPNHEMRKPAKWRKGQMMFNFLEFCLNNGVPGNQNARLADTFHLSDKQYDELWEAFCNQINA